jgi:hypothetical protein
MKRFWIVWYSENYIDTRFAHACTRPPFQFWESHGSLWAVIDADSMESAEDSIRKHYPDAEGICATEQVLDWQPGSQFPGFQNQTSIVE